MKPLLILASSSRYRRELLDRLCLPYESISPDVDESAQPGETPRETALRLAELKARAVWNQHPGSVVIGSDQTADLHGVRPVSYTHLDVYKRQPVGLREALN